MKKISFLITLTVLFAMLLAACGGGGAADGTLTPGQDLTGMPTLGTDLGTPTVGTGDELGTPTLGSELDTTPSVETTMDTTPSVDTTPETVATLGTTSTPQAGTGMGSDQFVLLSDLLKMQVNTADGSSLGSVVGVVVNRPIPATGSGSMDTTQTPDADSTLAVTPTTDVLPTTDAESDTTTGMQGPAISYLVINKSSASGSTELTDTTATPMATEDATPMATDALTTATPSSGSGDSGSTTALGSEVLIPWAAVSTDAGQSSGSTTSMQALTLNIEAAALAGAPSFSSAMDSSVAQTGWDTSITQYWTGEGMQIPVTGSSSPMGGSSIVLRSPLQTMSVVDGMAENFGQVSDYVVDLSTGMIRYAVLSQGMSGSEPSQGSYYLVPFTALTWGGTGSSAGGLNSMTLNGESSAFSGAPSITSMDNMDFSNLSEVDTYWMSQGK